MIPRIQWLPEIPRPEENQVSASENRKEQRNGQCLELGYRADIQVTCGLASQKVVPYERVEGKRVLLPSSLPPGSGVSLRTGSGGNSEGGAIKVEVDAQC